MVPYSRPKAQLALDRVGWADRHAAHAPRVRHTHYGKYDWANLKGEARFDWRDQAHVRNQLAACMRRGGPKVARIASIGSASNSSQACIVAQGGAQLIERDVADGVRRAKAALSSG